MCVIVLPMQYYLCSLYFVLALLCFFGLFKQISYFTQEMMILTLISACRSSPSPRASKTKQAGRCMKTVGS